MIQTQSRPLKQLFGDVDFAWQLLQSEVKLETSDNVTGQDVSQLLQLYMKGVQKMNSFLDYRQSYFKERVVTLMSRPTVMKTINSSKNVMSKKNISPIGSAQKIVPQVTKSKSGSSTRTQNKTEMLHLKQKRRQIELRLAYGTQQNTPQVLNKMIAQQSQKQSILTTKITKIVQNHQQNLMKRIKQRKLKTLAAKSLSNALLNHNEKQEGNQQIRQNKFKLRQKKFEQQFGSYVQIKQTPNLKRKYQKLYRSLSPKKPLNSSTGVQSPLRRTISYNMAVHVSHQNVKLWNFQNIIKLEND